MAAMETPRVNAGFAAPQFELPATDGRRYRLADVQGEKGMLLIFICNHCPYVQKQISRIVNAAKTLQAEGVGVAAICSNDADAYPEDSFEKMQAYARQEGFCFPYLHDETQQVAKAYGAVCTPDFFGFDAAATLQFRGRLDTSWSGIEEEPTPELVPAMLEIARTGKTSIEQHPSIGCSIKWKR